MSVIPIVTCKDCPQRCDGKSLGRYPQEQYYKFGENQEAKIMASIQSKANGIFTCRKSANWREAHTKPDLELRLASDPFKTVARLEVKHITRAFMLVERCVEAPLVPWETIVVNTAKIRRYAELYEEEGIPTHLVWRIDRACLPGKFFYQDIRVLKDIVDHYGKKREHKRDGKDGDPVNYHFSVNELMPFDIDSYLSSLQLLLRKINQGSQVANNGYDYPEYEFTDADAPPEYGY